MAYTPHPNRTDSTPQAGRHANDHNLYNDTFQSHEARLDTHLTRLNNLRTDIDELTTADAAQDDDISALQSAVGNVGTKGALAPRVAALESKSGGSDGSGGTGLPAVPDGAGRLFLSNTGDPDDINQWRTVAQTKDDLGVQAITAGATAPATPKVGDIWIDTSGA